MKKNTSLIALVALGVLLLGAVFFFQTGSFGTRLLWNLSEGGTWLLPLVTVAALLDSINPCAFSVLILTIAFLMSIGRLRERILLVGGTYIAGLFAVYLAIGLGILGTLHIFNTPHFMARLGASLLIAFGAINLINEFFPRFPIKLKIPDSAHHKMSVLIERASFPTAFGLGVLVGLCEFPCTGGPYLMVLGLLHDVQTYLKGFAYLVFYNIIFVLPLAILLFIASNKQLLGKVEAWQKENKRGMKLWTGFAMILLGVIIFAL